MSIAAPPLRLGVNLDHVATLRNARGGAHPDPVRFARLASKGGRGRQDFSTGQRLRAEKMREPHIVAHRHPELCKG